SALLCNDTGRHTPRPLSPGPLAGDAGERGATAMTPTYTPEQLRHLLAQLCYWTLPLGCAFLAFEAAAPLPSLEKLIFFALVMLDAGFLLGMRVIMQVIDYKGGRYARSPHP